MHQGHGRNRALCAHQSLLASLSLDLDEGQRVVTFPAVHERAFAARRVGVGKPVVDHADQGLGRAEIGLQHVMASRGGPARLHVAVDVGTAESINRLLGVPDQQQRTVPVVGPCLVNLVKDPVLQRRGVLELVNQDDRVLRQDALTQARAVYPPQRGVEAVQHVRKTEAAALALELEPPLRHLGRGMQPNGHADFGQLVDGFLENGKLGKFRRQCNRRSIGFAGRQQTRRDKSFPAGLQVGFIRLYQAIGPVPEGAQPTAVIPGAQPAPVPSIVLPGSLRVQPVLHGLGAHGPALLELI